MKCSWILGLRAWGALVAARPEKFFQPIQSDLRYHWVRVWLDAIDGDEMRELVVDSSRMVVPKRVAAEYFRDVGHVDP